MSKKTGNPASKEILARATLEEILNFLFPGDGHPPRTLEELESTNLEHKWFAGTETKNVYQECFAPVSRVATLDELDLKFGPLKQKISKYKNMVLLNFTYKDYYANWSATEIWPKSIYKYVLEHLQDETIYLGELAGKHSCTEATFAEILVDSVDGATDPETLVLAADEAEVKSGKIWCWVQEEIGEEIMDCFDKVGIFYSLKTPLLGDTKSSDPGNLVTKSSEIVDKKIFKKAKANPDFKVECFDVDEKSPFHEFKCSFVDLEIIQIIRDPKEIYEFETTETAETTNTGKISDEQKQNLGQDMDQDLEQHLKQKQELKFFLMFDTFFEES